MPLATKTNLKLEILLATMHRDSLDFLTAMFPNGDYLDYNILIVNQTTKSKMLNSSYDNIRVINSYETGLSKSRSLAIDNAIGDVCLLADDDIKYNTGFEKTILNSFTNRPEATVITYKMKDFNGNDFKNYKQQKIHNIKTIATANAVVVAFKIKKIREKNIRFNPHFGLGATFKTADEYIFLRDCMEANLEPQFYNEYIVSHDAVSSGQDSGSDTLVFARAALYYKYKGILGYLKLCKYLYYLVRHNYFGWSQFSSKLKIGLNGITTYRRLVKSEKE